MSVRGRRLLTRGESSPKIRHGDLDKYESAILHLLPHTEGGGRTRCPWSTPGCRATCLNYAGRGQMESVQSGRAWKTQLWRENKQIFEGYLETELQDLERRANRKRTAGGLKKQACVRLDGTSDLGLAVKLAPRWPRIIFYDYTKSPDRYTRWLELDRKQWQNRYLTFSRSETNEDFCRWALDAGGTVVIVFGVKKGMPLPERWWGWKVIDGDLHDFRFLDPPGVVVGVRAKGLAKKDKSGFVVQLGGS